jgi:hypothetical protein
MRTKAFDCVEMKHRGAEQLKETIERMTVQQELAFWAERSNELKERQAAAKARIRPPGDTPLKAPA